MLFSKVSNTTLLINSDFLIQPLGCFPDFTVFMIFLNSWCQVPSLLKSTFKFHILTPTGHCWTLLDSATRTFLILLSCTKSSSVWIKNTSVKSERHAFFKIPTLLFCHRGKPEPIFIELQYDSSIKKGEILLVHAANIARARPRI